MSGKALALILDGEPRLVGTVTLSRSRDKWYAATPWADAVTGSHPIAVLNQAFRAKGLAAGSELLSFYAEMRRFESMVIERRTDGLVRVTIRNAERGESAWPNMEDEELTARHLDAHYHDLRVGLYPLALEQPRATDFAARFVADPAALDGYELQLLRGWAQRWIREQRRLAGDPETEFDVAVLERLALALQVDVKIARRLASRRRARVEAVDIVVDPGQMTIKRDGVEISVSEYFESGPGQTTITGQTGPVDDPEGSS